MKKIYLASHFFNDAMFRWTEDLAKYIEENLNVELYVPQRNGEINDKKNNDATITDLAIYEQDCKELMESDILVACIDGVEIDPGVAGEIMAFATKMKLQKDKPLKIIGIVTDMRYNGTGRNMLYRNLMIVGAIKANGTLLEGYAGTDEYKKKLIDEIKMVLDMD